MPIGPYDNFQVCVSDQLSKGYDKEQAGAICGMLEKRSQMQKVDKGDTIDIKHVPIMTLDEDAKGQKVDEAWMQEAVSIHLENKKNGYIPTVFIGHNNDYEEKKAEAFLDNLEYDQSSGTLYADLIDLQKDKEGILRDYPYRSPETFGSFIAGLALLGSNAPYFRTPALFAFKDMYKSFIYKFNEKTMDKKETIETPEEKDETQEVEKEETPQEDINLDAEKESVVEPVEKTNDDAEKTIESNKEEEVSQSDNTDNGDEEKDNASVDDGNDNEEKTEEKTEEDQSEHFSMSSSVKDELTKYKMEVIELKKKIEYKELQDQINKFTATTENQEGKLTPLMSEKALNFCQKVDVDARNEFFAFLNELPSLSVKFQELGHDEEVEPEDKEAAFIEEVNKYAKENNVTAAEATKQLSDKL